MGCSGRWGACDVFLFFRIVAFVGIVRSTGVCQNNNTNGFLVSRSQTWCGGLCLIGGFGGLDCLVHSPFRSSHPECIHLV